MDRCTPLILASSKGHLAVVEALAAAGAEKEAKAVNGVTPLIAASCNGHPAVVEVLVRAGAEKEATSKSGCTPLIAASGKGHLAVVQVLVRAGAEMAGTDVSGWTPLFMASSHGHAAVVEALVRAGVEKETKDAEGCTPLAHASGLGHLAVVEVLVRATANLRWCEQLQMFRTVELFARDRGHTAVADLLLRHLEEQAEQAMVSLLLLEDDAGTGTRDGQGQAVKKAKSKKTKKAKQKLRASKVQHAAAAGAALAAAQRAQGQAKDCARQQCVCEELLQNRAEAAVQEQEFKRETARARGKRVLEKAGESWWGKQTAVAEKKVASSCHNNCCSCHCRTRPAGNATSVLYSTRNWLRSAVYATQLACMYNQRCSSTSSNHTTSSRCWRQLAKSRNWHTWSAAAAVLVSQWSCWTAPSASNAMQRRRPRTHR